MKPLTAMGGLLVREPGGWYWRDGRPEPRVRDLTAADCFQFPRVAYPSPERAGERVYYVAVPRRSLREEPELAEVIEQAGGSAREPPQDPGVVEVPADVWDAWAPGRVIGVAWEADDEEDLLATATRLARTGG